MDSFPERRKKCEVIIKLSLVFPESDYCGLF